MRWRATALTVPRENIRQPGQRHSACVCLVLRIQMHRPGVKLRPTARAMLDTQVLTADLALRAWRARSKQAMAQQAARNALPASILRQ